MHWPLSASTFQGLTTPLLTSIPSQVYSLFIFNPSQISKIVNRKLCQGYLLICLVFANAFAIALVHAIGTFPAA